MPLITTFRGHRNQAAILWHLSPVSMEVQVQEKLEINAVLLHILLSSIDLYFLLGFT